MEDISKVSVLYREQLRRGSNRLEDISKVALYEGHHEQGPSQLHDILRVHLEQVMTRLEDTTRGSCRLYDICCLIPFNICRSDLCLGTNNI